MDRACYSKNLKIGHLGFSPIQIAYSPSSFILGISEGNMNMDELSDSEIVERIMRRQMQIKEEFRKADISDRLKKLPKERICMYKDTTYEPGDRV